MEGKNPGLSTFAKECKKSKFSSMAIPLYDLKRLLYCLQNNELQGLYGGDIFIQMWKITSDHFYRVSKVLVSSITKLWGICKKFIFQKNEMVYLLSNTKGISADKLSKFKHLIQDSLTIAGHIFMDALFIGQSERQQLPESMTTKINAEDFQSPESFMEVIHECHPLIICYFGRKIMSICGDCYDEIRKLKIDDDLELLEPLSLTIEALRFKLISSISEGVSNGTFLFFLK